MTEVSPILALPFLMPAQAQKHVTHNEALALLDVMVQLAVESFGATLPPAVPMEGEVHALGAGATGPWAGQDGKIAAFTGNAWAFLAPRPGWRVWGKAEGALRVWNGGAWTDLSGSVAFDNLPGVGINATADAVNRLAVAAASTLLTHEGAGHQLKINKAATGDTASLLFQSGWSGRAEMGLAGSDAFAVKVSPNGSAWTTALSLDPATGAAALAAGLTVDGKAAVHRGNILGPVGQSGGQPTGAVIERGAGATGAWVRFADGTQVCTHSATRPNISTAQGGVFVTSNLTWTFPMAFAANPSVHVSLDQGSAWGNGYATSASAATLRGFSSTSVAGTVNLFATAVGRWF